MVKFDLMDSFLGEHDALIKGPPLLFGTKDIPLSFSKVSMTYSKKALSHSHKVNTSLIDKE